MLIVSLPPVHQKELLRKIITHPKVDAVRYNTGMSSAYPPAETVRRIMEIARPLKKPVYIDLKGKQLRVIEWANLPEGPIVLNHEIKVELPAKVCFRGDDCCEIIEVVNGQEIYVDPLPKAPVGRGQAVNILSSKLEIKGGLLPLDHEYIKAGLRENVTGFLLSFVENQVDIKELEDAIIEYAPGFNDLHEFERMLKIESQAGVDFVRDSKPTDLHGYRLVAARDDLMIQIGLKAMPEALTSIINRDSQAICASRLLLGLENGDVSLADLSDINYMRKLGYEHFMLSDGVSRDHFDKAMKFWENFSD
ncbi:hypothetical protein HY967_03985 [Candidatus Jorgensenbacteria bacterium]|nr:hypothetical protein [Candidatus Jorgensenbacteria bacterium]